MSTVRIICFIFCVGFCAAAYAEDCERYADTGYGYSICLPDTWSKSYKDIGYKHVLSAMRKGGPEIVVAASRYDDEEKEKWNSWKRWYARGTGGIMNIVESREIAAGKNVTVKVLVFDYTHRGKRMIQRTMLTKYNENIMVVECRAPVKSYGKYTGVFNMVMSSVDFTGKLAGENIESLKDAGFKPGRRRSARHVVREKRETRPEPKPITEDTPIFKPKPEPKPITEDAEVEKKQPEKEPEIFKTKPDSSIETKGLKEADPAEVEKLKKLQEEGIIEMIE
ncbi:MAG: hypothetical protein JW807_14885 [Spirochaetes bacterium]|nr:hypothetical protein [Spirochaetota bacterium]